MDKFIQHIDMIDSEYRKLLIKGIYMIETHYRPMWFRIVEYFWFAFNVTSHVLFKNPIKNLTIGRFQVGIINILRYRGRKFTYNNSDYIESLSLSEYFYVLRACHSDLSVKVIDWLICELLKDKEFYSFNTQARFIGLAYNGSYEYAIELEDWVIRHQGFHNFA
ncbi:hypothetical protein EDC18_103348 [Natranaerovirga pectinivora]|uniref:Uncharacterized protein n=1 Tax=Natranaerovirga pectinivora TaxID=682400 RepID=A0A4V2V0E9_9FIRM|nr:hypothetical protein [Natranaerovirga pectinivora]TCT15640.1 hypothetical protein EDC18_103348 [Natranaerovirga pectinivora]